MDRGLTRIFMAAAAAILSSTVMVLGEKMIIIGVYFSFLLPLKVV